MQFIPLALFVDLFLLDKLLLLFTALSGNFHEIFAIKLLFFEIHLSLLMLLRSSNQLLLVLLFFGLLDDELGCETLLPYSNLIDLLLIIFGQKYGF